MAYFANGTEGMTLHEQCDDCHLPDDAPCPVLLVHLEYNYEQVGNELARKIMLDLVDKDGQCLMRKEIDKLNIFIPDCKDPKQRKLWEAG